MATQAQRDRLKEAMEKNGGRLNVHGMQDQSITRMFHQGLLETRELVDPAALAAERDRLILQGRDALAAGTDHWRGALTALRLAAEADEQIVALEKARTWLAKGRPLDRYAIMRLAHVIGVFVTERGRGEAALAGEARR